MEKLCFSDSFPPGLCHFPENSYTNGWSPYTHTYTMTPARDPKQRENHEKSRFSSFFSMICWSKPIPKPPENPSDHFEPVSASPDHSQPILQHFYITKSIKKRGGYPCFPFLEGISPWDHAHLKENNVSRSRHLTRALYDHWAPHW